MSEHTEKIQIKQAQPLPLGAWAEDGGIRFSVDVTDSTQKTRLVIRRKGTKEMVCEVVMNEYPACGNICAVFIRGLPRQQIYYQYVRGQEIVEDIYGMKLYGSRKYGVFKTLEERAAYEPFKDRFDWEGDARPSIAWHEMVMYKLHVRSFSRHPSSGISHKGTFVGIAEKIPYFKELGVNALVLMPVVDFAEIQARKLPRAKLPPTILSSTQNSSKSQDIAMLSSMAGNDTPKLYTNCWGYGEAQFFAPKGAYAAGDARTEFCAMVRELHSNGIEVILELLFPETMAAGAILDCLRHWAMHYHVDGFWLNREIAPMEMAATDPMLSGVKLICGGFDTSRIYGKKIPAVKRLAYAGDGFQNTMRCFLKGDGNCLDAFVRESTFVDVQQGAVHYITSNNGFTLADLVSYNDKHNESNGEENRDGSDYNLSWNCGAEGRTRSKKVMELRRRQRYNAMLLLLLSSGTPMIYGGDEFGNSQQGNNNAYCQDNEQFWLNWRELKKNKELFEFVKSAVKLRQSHPVLSPAKPFRQMDYLSCGFPDLSVHGHQPWKASFGSEDRYIGLMYCGKYARFNGHEDNSFYIAYNMHWEWGDIDLPALQKGQKWEKIADTFYKEPFKWEKEADAAAPDVSGAAASVSSGAAASDIAGNTRGRVVAAAGEAAAPADVAAAVSGAAAANIAAPAQYRIAPRSIQIYMSVEAGHAKSSKR